MEDDNYDNDLINQLLQLELGTKDQIINAMDNVVNSNDIDEITEYLIATTNEIIVYDDADDEDQKQNVRTHI